MAVSQVWLQSCYSFIPSLTMACSVGHVAVLLLAFVGHTLAMSTCSEKVGNILLEGERLHGSYLHDVSKLSSLIEHTISILFLNSWNLQNPLLFTWFHKILIGTNLFFWNVYYIISKVISV